jgi:hypothetical protein
MTNRIVIWLGVVFAVATFAITHGWEEYQMARSGRSYTIVDGVERDLTPGELVSNILIGDSLLAVPFGIVAVAILYLPLWRVAVEFKRLSRLSASLLGLLIGGAAGGILSFVVWLLLGGWGPPFVGPSVSAGAVLIIALIAGTGRGKGSQSGVGLGEARPVAGPTKTTQQTPEHFR